MSVADPYRWLEEGDRPEVQAWGAAQERHLRAALDPWPGRDRVRNRLRALFSIGTLGPPVPRRGLYFYEKRSGAQEQPVLYVREGFAGPDRALLDPTTQAADAACALDWHYPSPDGRLLAYGLSEGGSEKSTLRVLEVATGRDLGEAIPFTRACSLEWQPDGSAFYYTRYPEPGSVPPGQEDYNRRVFFHRLGTDWQKDALVFAPEEPEDWPNVHLSPDGQWLAVSVSRGWTRTDVYLRGRDGQFVTVVAKEEAVSAADLSNDSLFLSHQSRRSPFPLHPSPPRAPRP